MEEKNVLHIRWVLHECSMVMLIETFGVFEVFELSRIEPNFGCFSWSCQQLLAGHFENGNLMRKRHASRNKCISVYIHDISIAYEFRVDLQKRIRLYIWQINADIFYSLYFVIFQQHWLRQFAHGYEVTVTRIYISKYDDSHFITKHDRHRN